MHNKPFVKVSFSVCFLTKTRHCEHARKNKPSIREGNPKLVQTPYLGQIHRTSLLLAPRPREDIGHEHIEKCVDCEAMGFHID